MEKIDPNAFDKTLLKVNIPAYNGESHYSKITYNGMPIIIQTPQTLTKQGIIKHGKKLVCDIMFNSIETEFLHWIEEVETQLQQILYENSSSWFDQTFQLDDIETLFLSPIKMFKSGKYYLLRAYLKDSLKVFRDNHGVSLTYMDITQENNIISILEFKGIKYTSRDFQLDIEIKQIMIVQTDPYENNCFINIKEPKTHLGKKMLETIGFSEFVSKPKINIENELNPEITEIKKDIEPNIGTDLKEITIGDNLEESDIRLNSSHVLEIYNDAKKEAIETKQLAINAHIKLREIEKKYNIEPDSD